MALTCWKLVLCPPIKLRPRPVPVLQLFGHGEDRVCIDGAVVIIKDNAVLAVPVHFRAPAVSAQVVGDAVEGVRFGEEVDAAVLIGVHAVGEDVGGHELAQADRPVDRTPDAERIDAVPVGQTEQRLDLVVGPVALLAAAATGELPVLQREETSVHMGPDGFKVG